MDRCKAKSIALRSTSASATPGQATWLVVDLTALNFTAETLSRKGFPLRQPLIRTSEQHCPQQPGFDSSFVGLNV